MTEPSHELFREREQRPPKEPAGSQSSGSREAKIRVDTVADEHGFLALGPMWDQLVQEAKLDHPFARTDWMGVWGRRSGQLRGGQPAPPEDMQQKVTEGFHIEAAAWKAKHGTAILCRPELVCFYRDTAEEAARSGLLRLILDRK